MSAMSIIGSIFCLLFSCIASLTIHSTILLFSQTKKNALSQAYQDARHYYLIYIKNISKTQKEVFK